jgi:hypothetical protein
LKTKSKLWEKIVDDAIKRLSEHRPQFMGKWHVLVHLWPLSHSSSGHGLMHCSWCSSSSLWHFLEQ